MERLQYNIESFLRSGEGDFSRLALELFAYQFERNPPYQAYCQSLGITPSHVKGWQNIPAVPIQAFKSAALATFPPNQAAAIFQSSRTTGQTSSRHYLRALTYYETALKASFAAHLLEDKVKMPLFILAPSPAEAPHSSLSWMLDVVKRAFGAAGSVALVTRGRLDELWLATLLARAEATHEPVALLGTTIAFLGFFDYAQKAHKKYKLAAGSRLMDTGGMKTEKREISRAEFVRRAGEVFGIPEKACFNEYGMCELSSQFYGQGVSSYLEGPAWTRTLVIDPVTGQAAAAGTPGLLRHFDLANVDSVLAIQTEDIGVADGTGFVLQGRDPGAEVKGCSLSAEAFLS
jgi:hypothetical protein